MNTELRCNLGKMLNRHSEIIISQLKALKLSKTERKGEESSEHMTISAYNTKSLKAQVEHFRLDSLARG